MVKCKENIRQGYNNYGKVSNITYTIFYCSKFDDDCCKNR